MKLIRIAFFVMMGLLSIKGFGADNFESVSESQIENNRPKIFYFCYADDSAGNRFEGHSVNTEGPARTQALESCQKSSPSPESCFVEKKCDWNAN